MPSGQYSYIDITALDAVRTRFAAGDALALLTPALDDVIWANGQGAALFGYPDIGAIIGREPEIGLAAKRQIMATSGYPHIGQNRAITIRLASGMTSRAAALVASEIALPGGEAAILLAAPNASGGWLSSAETAGRAIEGLGQAGQHAAIIDAGGKVVAASDGFASLDIGTDAIGALVSEAKGERLIKRMIEAGTAFLPAGFVRLTDDPATHLLVVVDEAPEVPDESQPALDAPSQAALPPPLSPPHKGEEDAATAPDAETSSSDSWYFAGGGQSEENDTPARQDAVGEVEAASPSDPLTVSGVGRDTSTPVPGGEEEGRESKLEERSAPFENGNGEDDAGEGGRQATVDDGDAAADGSAAIEDSIEEDAAASPSDPLTVSGSARATSPPLRGGEEPKLEGGAEPKLEAGEEPELEGGDEPELEGGDEPELEAGEEPELEERSALVDENAGKLEEAGSSPETSQPPSRTVVDRSAAPVRFVWKTDAEGRFSEISDDFVKAVGEAAATLVGVTFREVAERLGIDPDGDIAGLLERRDTWSGRSVMWPVAGTDLRIPVDLAALPAYGRDRQFAGFRGFGVARAGDAVVDPDAKGIELVEAKIVRDGGVGKGAEPIESEAAAPDEAIPESHVNETTSQAEQDPFRGEVPALSIVPKPDRRESDKVIRLAEHRPANGGDKGLSAGERNAFREIGDRLKKDAEAPAELHADNDHKPAPPPMAEPTRETEESRARDEASSGENLQAAAETINQLLAASENDGRGEVEQVEPTGDFEEADSGAEEPREGSNTGDVSDGTTPTPVESVSDVDPPTVSPFGRSTSPPIDGGEDTPTAMPGAYPLPHEHGGEVARARPETVRGKPENTAASHQEAARQNEPIDAEPTATPDFIPSAFALGAPPPRPPVDTTILEQLPVPVLIHSGDVLHYANREFLEFTGYDSVGELEEAGGLDALFGEPYADDPTEEGGRKPRLRTREGLEYPVEALLQSVPWGEGKALLLSLRRSWRQPVSYPASPMASVPATPTDPELEERIAEMRAIVDTATDGVVLIAPDGTIRSISSPAEALFGFDSAEVAGKPFVSLFAIESQRAARDYLAGLSENGVASVLNDGREVIGREGQGRFIPLFMTIGRLPNDSGFCAVVRDITQWKRAEEELTQARAQAERASSQKTDFLARVSHEIRTPLNAIIGFSELMLDEKFGPILNDRYRDYLRDINRSGNHVLDLVNDLLDISKIEAGQQEMSYEAVSLNDTLTETVAMMQPQANRERVIIRSSFASRLPEVVADLRSIRQIALNLMSNAIRYTPAGGQVIVSTAYEPSGDVVMRVRDTGIGMSQAEIEQALKPFKQINALKRTRGDGTGLGLPLTKAMVEANRARFMINSTPGEGTLVEITFPSTRVLAE